MAARKMEGLVTERVGGELLVYDGTRSEAHALNDAAALVFELCDGATSRATMAAEVARRSALPADEEIVEYALAELADAGLVVVDEPPAPGLTRRALMRRLGLTVVTAAALPVVESIVAPSIAAAAPVAQPVPPQQPSPSAQRGTIARC